MKSVLAQADENKIMGKGLTVSCKVTERPPAIGKVVYSKPDGINLQINIVNSPIGYPPDVRQGFGEMIQILQEEGKIGSSGSIAIATLEKM